jgi:hypothetical protein
MIEPASLNERIVGMDERRSEPRRRVLQTGKIVLDTGGVIDCTIRDRSSSGARLKVATVIGIPDKFALLIGPDEKHSVDVTWRKQGELGVHFAS